MACRIPVSNPNPLDLAERDAHRSAGHRAGGCGAGVIGHRGGLLEGVAIFQVEGPEELWGDEPAIPKR